MWLCFLMTSGTDPRPSSVWTKWHSWFTWTFPCFEPSKDPCRLPRGSFGENCSWKTHCKISWGFLLKWAPVFFTPALVAGQKGGPDHDHWDLVLGVSTTFPSRFNCKYRRETTFCWVFSLEAAHLNTRETRKVASQVRWSCPWWKNPSLPSSFCGSHWWSSLGGWRRCPSWRCWSLGEKREVLQWASYCSYWWRFVGVLRGF